MSHFQLRKLEKILVKNIHRKAEYEEEIVSSITDNQMKAKH